MNDDTSDAAFGRRGIGQIQTAQNLEYREVFDENLARPRPVSLAVRTRPSQGWDRSSILLRGTIHPIGIATYELACI